MALLDISQYDRMPVDGLGHSIPTGLEPQTAQVQVAIGAGSVQSAVFDQGTQFVRLHTDVACRIEFGVNPTAAATSKRMAANATEYFGVKKASSGPMRVAVIATT